MPGKRDSAVTDHDDTRKSQTWMSKNQGKHDFTHIWKGCEFSGSYLIIKLKQIVTDNLKVKKLRIPPILESRTYFMCVKIMVFII